MLECACVVPEWAAIAKIASESTVIRGSERAQEWGASRSSSFEDDPVVDADDRPVTDGMVVGVDRRVTLRVVADVHEQLVRGLGNGTRSSSSDAGVRCLTTVA